MLNLDSEVLGLKYSTYVTPLNVADYYHSSNRAFHAFENRTADFSTVPPFVRGFLSPAL